MLIISALAIPNLETRDTSGSLFGSFGWPYYGIIAQSMIILLSPPMLSHRLTPFSTVQLQVAIKLS